MSNEKLNFLNYFRLHTQKMNDLNQTGYRLWKQSLILTIFKYIVFFVNFAWLHKPVILWSSHVYVYILIVIDMFLSPQHLIVLQNKFTDSGSKNHRIKHQLKIVFTIKCEQKYDQFGNTNDKLNSAKYDDIPV